MSKPPVSAVRVSFVVLLALANGCGSSGSEIDRPPVPGTGLLDTGTGPGLSDGATPDPMVNQDGGPGGPGPDAPPGTDTPYIGPPPPPPPPPKDGGADLGPDVPLGGDTNPPPKDGGADLATGASAEKRYADFRAERDRLLIERLVSCFNGDMSAQVPVVAGESELDLSLRFALAALDDQAATACLQAIRAETCEALAAQAHGPACAVVVMGQLAAGGFCRADQDCRDADKSFCRRGPATICNTRCLPRAADGERCASGSECLPGSICQPGPDGTTTVCAARLLDGEACDGDSCLAGLYCRATSANGPDGKCSPIKAGGECAGTWQCPPFHACLLSPSGLGVCGAGRKAGEACQVHVADQPTISDCGFDLGCYPDLASGQLRCSAGRKMGEACTDLIPCAVGQCVAGKCAPFQTAGQSCSEELSCAEGQACVAAKCAPEILPPGSPCGGVEKRTCTAGTFCSGGMDAAGTCVPSKKLNETCQPGQCEPALDCVGGTCRKCS